MYQEPRCTPDRRSHRSMCRRRDWVPGLAPPAQDPLPNLKALQSAGGQGRQRVILFFTGHHIEAVYVWLTKALAGHWA